uniref:Uncharacterized protein MANES_14G078500 n=1 Tax=Rhizophora mucronata TaxID=61149 RepID=A0A2P2KXE3_RHIMU
MPSHNRDIHINEIEILLLSNKCVCPHNIKRSNTKELLRIINTLLLQDFSSNWHRRVDWITDNVDESIRAVISNSLYQGHDYVGINAEQIITGHTRLSWNSSRYDNNIYTF